MDRRRPRPLVGDIAPVRIAVAKSDSDISGSFPVMQQLRPHLPEAGSSDAFARCNARDFTSRFLPTIPARAHGCVQLELDSGVQRYDAHRFYFRERMHISVYHFVIPLTP